MSLFGSLFSGVSGLAAQSQSMGMISDNVSNVNTVAYKGAAAQFSTLVTRSLATSTFNPGGVRAGTLYHIERQGLLQTSSSPTDAAIDGRGFFVVNTAADGSGDQLYTRAGSFQSDFLGNLRNAAGFYLQGWVLDNNGEIVNPSQPQTVNVGLINGVATPTTMIELGINLDANQPVAGAYAAGEMATFHSSGGTAGVEPHFTHTLEIFDSLGRSRNVTVAFLKDATPNVWNVEMYAEAGEVEAADHPDGLLASGQVTFNGDGTLLANDVAPILPAGALIGINWLDADGAQNSEIALDLGTPDASDGLTQFGAEFTLAFANQNGVQFGRLNGVSIDENGFVIASFANGTQRRIYKLPIATFANPMALDPRSGNVYAETDGSGRTNLREAGRGGAGKIAPSALEAANVDLADEFTKMIVTQRAYSANARVISTADEMLDELVRITR